jgi:hypothetical protein
VRVCWVAGSSDARAWLQDVGKQFGFLLVTAARTYRIYATSKPEQQEWMTSIKNAKTDFIKRRQEAARRAEVRGMPLEKPSYTSGAWCVTHARVAAPGEHPRGHAHAARRDGGLPSGLVPATARDPVRGRERLAGSRARVLRGAREGPALGRRMRRCGRRPMRNLSSRPLRAMWPTRCSARVPRTSPMPVRLPAFLLGRRIAAGSLTGRAAPPGARRAQGLCRYG